MVVTARAGAGRLGGALKGLERAGVADGMGPRAIICTEAVQGGWVYQIQTSTADKAALAPTLAIRPTMLLIYMYLYVHPHTSSQ